MKNLTVPPFSQDQATQWQQDNNQEPVFYFLEPGNNEGSHSCPLAPEAYKNRPTFVIIPPNKVYRFENREYNGADCIMLTLCNDVICLQQQPLPPSSDLNGQKQQ